ncbi:hypothetical protein M7I_1925 [Glarea lozoyensis 74030]|uniref:Uncharacterized protein n=1 Tax=Glarea lozoyensis (strain ATCC 74030 / MF5533) TaxID=1104152 RepID=H0EHE7_GLAL7|nr:hypothetical protein M7I_1925 [Glarea lozoyensis 74030]
MRTQLHLSRANLSYLVEASKSERGTQSHGDDLATSV